MHNYTAIVFLGVAWLVSSFILYAKGRLDERRRINKHVAALYTESLPAFRRMIREVTNG